MDYPTITAAQVAAVDAELARIEAMRIEELEAAREDGRAVRDYHILQAEERLRHFMWSMESFGFITPARRTSWLIQLEDDDGRLGVEGD